MAFIVTAPVSSGVACRGLARRRKSSMRARSTLTVSAISWPVSVRRAAGCHDDAHNLPLRGKVRVAQRRFHGLQPGVAVGSIHLGVEARVQRQARCRSGVSRKSGVSVSPSTTRSRSVPW